MYLVVVNTTFFSAALKAECGEAGALPGTIRSLPVVVGNRT